jgi:hypothetical protein
MQIFFPVLLKTFECFFECIFPTSMFGEIYRRKEKKKKAMPTSMYPGNSFWSNVTLKCCGTGWRSYCTFQASTGLCFPFHSSSHFHIEAYQTAQQVAIRIRRKVPLKSRFKYFGKSVIKNKENTEWSQLNFTISFSEPHIDKWFLKSILTSRKTQVSLLAKSLRV